MALLQLGNVERTRSENLLWLRDHAVAAASSGIVITDATLPDNPIIDVNPAFERLTGYRATEAIGRNCRFLQGPETDRSGPAEIRDAVREGRECTVTLLNERRDGTPFWNELHVSPVRTDSGRLTHFIGFLNDVTALRRAEESRQFLTEVSAVLASSLDYAHTVKIVTDLAVPRIADWCAIHLIEESGTNRVFALADSDLANVTGVRSLEERYPIALDAPHGVPQVLRTGQARLYSEAPDHLLAALARDAAPLAALRGAGVRSAIIVPLLARERTIGAMSLITTRRGRRFDLEDLALAEDLARRVASAVDSAQLYAQAQAAIHSRDQFLSIAAHELRTPVASIKGYAQLLLRGHARGTLVGNRLGQSLRTIEAATDRLSVLTDDLLDVSRIRLGRLPVRPQSLDLCSFVHNLAGRYRDQFGAEHPIHVDTPDGPCRVAADAERLDQVLSNLVANAAKYSDSGAPVALIVRPVASDGAAGYRLAVRDEGIGLPADAVETIFEPFGRAPNAAAANIPGLGLGLYICRSIVERHGGRIWPESAGEGRGTTMCVWLPSESG